MKIELIANVFNVRQLAGKNSSGEWDKSVFNGFGLNVNQFTYDSDSNRYRVDQMYFVVPPDVIGDNHDIKIFDQFAPYRFVVDMIQYSSSVSYRVVSFKRVADDEKHKHISFSLGR